MLSSLFGLLCLCVWVYHCLKCHQSIPCFQWSRNSTTSNPSRCETCPSAWWLSGVFPLESARVKKYFCHMQPQLFNFAEINLGPARNTPFSRTAFSRNREGNREENLSLSPKCTTIHQKGLLTADTSQGHSVGMLLIICLLADVLQSLPGKSR